MQAEDGYATGRERRVLGNARDTLARAWHRQTRNSPGD